MEHHDGEHSKLCKSCWRSVAGVFRKTAIGVVLVCELCGMIIGHHEAPPREPHGVHAEANADYLGWQESTFAIASGSSTVQFAIPLEQFSVPPKPQFFPKPSGDHTGLA